MWLPLTLMMQQYYQQCLSHCHAAATYKTHLIHNSALAQAYCSSNFRKCIRLIPIIPTIFSNTFREYQIELEKKKNSPKIKNGRNKNRPLFSILFCSYHFIVVPLIIFKEYYETNEPSNINCSHSVVIKEMISNAVIRQKTSSLSRVVDAKDNMCMA